MNADKYRAKYQAPGQSVAEKSLQAMNQSIFDQLTHLFRNAHAICMQSRPYTDFPWLCNLDEAKGICIGNQYRNADYAKTFIKAIANAERAKLQTKMEQVKFLSGISDGSTDSSRTEAEIIFLRFCHHGVIENHFVAVENVPKEDAATISGAILRALERLLGESFKSKMVGMGTDGASVMLGKKSGVVARIREILERPFILGIHCSGHKVELAYKDAVKDQNLYKKVDALLIGLYYFYRNSPLNRSNLKATAGMLHAKVLVPVRVGGTRWVSHVKLAIENLLNSYSSIVLHLKQVTAFYLLS